MKNNYITPVVAGNEDMAMPKEVEETLNQFNTKERKIERGTEIRNGKEAVIYELTFLKDILKLYLPYLLDWSDWIEKESKVLQELHIDEFREMEQSELAGAFNQLKLEKGLCKSMISEIISRIDYAISIAKNDFSFASVQNTIFDMSEDMLSLDSLVSYLEICSRNDNRFNFYTKYFYNGIVTSPIYDGIDFIRKIINKLKNVKENYFEMEAE